MELVIVVLALAAGAVYVLTIPPGSGVAPVGQSSALLSPQQVQQKAQAVQPVPDINPPIPSVLGTAAAGASVGSVLPGAGTAIGFAAGALVGWIRSWGGPTEYERFQEAFAQHLGFSDFDALTRSLSSIGRDDLVYALPQGTPGDRLSYRKEALLPLFQTWMERVIQAYQDAGYQFPP